MTTKQTTPRYLRLNDEVWEKVEEYAHQQNRPLSNMLEQIVVEWIRLKDLEGVLDSVEEEER